METRLVLPPLRHRQRLTMPSPDLSSTQINEVSDLVAKYISDQRNRFFDGAANLSTAQKVRLAGFFRPDLLETTRVLVLQNERIGNPTFYSMLEDLGISNLPDFSQMAAITFEDVVVSHEPFSDGLLFHELVHVEQYRRLGIANFATLYVSGFLKGGGYHGIPLEINAYHLGGCFEADPDNPFSVENEVSKWIAQNGL
jgi:hypothetical protein